MTRPRPGPSVTQQVKFDALCVQFEQAWRQGQRPTIESFLEGSSEAEQPLLLSQLLLLELECLENAGDSPELDEYLTRFPHEHAIVQRAFDEHISALAAVKSQAPIQPERTIEQRPISERTGSHIGRYKLLEQIGEGGMGVVYMAEQQRPVRRKVALKIIRPGMDTKQVVARFEAERQALAMMDHPNVARVLDAGSTDSGRPYFVMELVRGTTITEYCDANKLDTNERLKLFKSVCQAVQHAHTKGIIHRDLKPANVLVTLHDSVPVPKIIDFGVSKAMGQQLTEKTMFTAFAQLVGTPLYMSPEQAEMSGLDVDTRSDIYSLGVLLYELLTGVTPFDRQRLHTAAFDELRRIIREEEPAKPSTRVSSLGEASATVSASRSTDANKLKQLLRGELDWIVMKALEKDRTRRYETANALAAEVDRYLDGDPVTACPPSATYRLRKFAHRYKSQVAVAGGFVALLLASSIVTSFLYVNARYSAATADDERRNAELARDEIAIQKELTEANLQRALEQERKVATLAAEQQRRLYDYNLIKAQSKFQMGHTLESSNLLADCLEEQRGWEWHRLKRQMGGLRALQLSESPFDCSAVSPVEPKIVTADREGTYRLYNLDTGEEIFSQPTGVLQPLNVIFSPAGDLVALAGVTSHGLTAPKPTSRIEVWETATGTKIWDTVLENQLVFVASFSPDARFMTLGSISPERGEGTVFLHDIKARELVWQQPATNGIPLPQYSPDGRHLFITSAIGPPGTSCPAKLRCWRVDGPHELWSVQTDTASLPCPTPDGKRVITGSLQNSLNVWDARSGQLLEKVTGEGQEIAAMSAFSPDAKYLISLGHLGGVVVRDWSTRQELLSFETPRQRTLSRPGFTDGGNQIVSHAEPLGVAIEFRAVVPTPGEITLQGHEDAVKAVAFAPNGIQISSSGRDGTLRMWNTSTGLELEAYPAHESTDQIAYASDGTTIATVGNDGAKLWSTETGELLHHWNAGERVRCIDVSPDGRRVIVGGSAEGKPALLLYDVESGRQLNAVDLPGSPPAALAFCADSRRVVWVMLDYGVLFVSDLESGTSEPIRPGGEDRRDTRFLVRSPQDNLVATVVTDSIEVWDVDRKQLVTTLELEGQRPYCLAFNHDGSRLFSGDTGGAVQVWNVDSGEQLLTIQAHEQVNSHAEAKLLGVTSLCLSPDRRTLATAGADGLVKLWETTYPSAAVAERRKIVSEATAVVNERSLALRSRRDVIASLTSDTSLGEEILQTAIDIANTRGDGQFLKTPTVNIKTTVNEIKRLQTNDPERARQLLIGLAESESGINAHARRTKTLPQSAKDWHDVAAALEEIVDLSHDELDELLAPLPAAYPHAHHFLYIRGHSKARRGMWREAERDLSAALARLPEESPGWHRLACSLGPLYVFLGDLENYRQLSHTMLADFHTDKDLYRAERTAKMCSLAPIDRGDLDRAATLVEKTLVKDAISTTSNFGWFTLAKAMINYRVGNWQLANSLLESVEEKYARNDGVYSPEHQNLLSMTYCYRSLCHQMLTDAAAARDALAAAERIINSDDFPKRGGDVDQPFWHDWVSVQLAYEEASKVVR